MESDGKFPFVLNEGTEYVVTIRGSIFDTFATYEGARMTSSGIQHEFRTTRHINAGSSFALLEGDISYVRLPRDW